MPSRSTGNHADEKMPQENDRWMEMVGCEYDEESADSIIRKGFRQALWPQSNPTQSGS